MRDEINKERKRRVENDVNTGFERARWIALLPAVTCLGIAVVVFLLSYLK
jgi:hypothetical protein